MSKGHSVSCIVNTSIVKAWNAYITDNHKWWPSEMYTSVKTKQFIIENKLGGLLYEDFGDGEGLAWGTIIGLDKPNSILIKGTLAKEFGGPATTIEKITFIQVGSGVEVSYHIDFVGVVDEKTKSSLAEGWQMILENHYKPFCENL